MGDKAVGLVLTMTSLSIFTYYTFWVIILPFVDDDHFVHQYFLPQEYAIFIPVFAGVVLLSFLSIFIGLVMLKSKKKKAAWWIWRLPRCSSGISGLLVEPSRQVSWMIVFHWVAFTCDPRLSRDCVFLVVIDRKVYAIPRINMGQISSVVTSIILGWCVWSM